MTSLLLAGFAGGLALFHSWLLWRRLADGVLLEPRVGLRWVAAVLLVTALAWLRGRGIPLSWGRKALGFWTLVLLLHAGTAGETAREGAGGGAACTAIVVLPATATLAAVLLVVCLLSVGRVGAAPSRSSRGLVPIPSTLPLLAGALGGLAARPPPPFAL